MPTFKNLIFLLSLILWLSSLEAVDGDTLVIGQSLSLNKTLVSSGGIFELGFFTPGSSSKEYVGVWYKVSRKTVIWVANRELPVVNTPGKLTLRENGVLEISDSENLTIWSSNSDETVVNPVAQLLDSGNFVVREGNRNALDAFAWQGFDYPCDTRVAGMKIGYDVRNKRNLYQSSWKSLDDPAKGEYIFQIDITGIPQYFFKKGVQETFRTGPWNGQTFSGIPRMKPDSFYRFSYTTDDEWVYFLHEPVNSSVLWRTVVDVNGTWHGYIWSNMNQDWNMTFNFVKDNCDTYNRCGPYASCNTNKSPICECLTGYVPKSQKEWNSANWTQGCVRTANCSNGDKFPKHSNVKVPDTRNAYGNMSLSLEECRIACLENCSCTAYGNWYVTYEGNGCLLWFGELKDIRVYPEKGQDIFVRSDYSETDMVDDRAKSLKVKIISSVLAALVLVFIVMLIICYRRRKIHLQRQSGTKDEMSRKTATSETDNSDLDLPLFDFETMSKATNYFSVANKLGEGGFGPVYKGLLRGQEIAVKRLSQDSKQGSVEFKNEVMCIAKLQHRNLVKLLGCCIQEEYMLVYEFMPNKSLDLLIFHDKEKALLDWPKRWNIINGIARGMLYLHQDSRLRIIHRDLKASNILLDSDMNPKISDFGMARICGGTETENNTIRVVGTYGYMSPEYAIEGLFSVKSDVFSFGVLILEIISGKRNRGFYHPDYHLNLLGYIWKLSNEGRFMEAVDESLRKSCDATEIMRAIQVGLLCVQESPHDRPVMASVVLMLSSDSRLPPSKAPGFFTSRKSVEPDSSSSNTGLSTTNTHLSATNEMSVTMMDPR